ncbi:tungsten ABC transporter permease [Acidovorax sp.]|uniref:tungsten ABC transporter permease n=1 Tax=Acidovorax sp. TaxID=1872122 RepID=UPI002626EC6C|nr:tungsten ABC transporter permease [Acidovorax sp.]
MALTVFKTRLVGRGVALAAALLALGPANVAAQSAPAPPPTVRVAAVGGLVLSGVWPRLAQQAGQALVLQVDTVAANPKEGVVPVFERGDAEVLLIHASDEALGLQASGHAAPVRVWAWNEHVLVGPAADPAQVRSARDGQDALRRIADTAAPFIAFRDPGSYTVVQRLWRRAGIRPDARWAHIDTGATPQAVLQQAVDLGAYAVVGHIPVAFGKMAASGIQVLLKGDPQMRRPYVVLTPGPRHPAGAQARRQALRLADYLVSPEGQVALAEADRAAGGPWLFGAASVPVAPAHVRQAPPLVEKAP